VVQKSAPSGWPRTFGHILAVLASLLIGYSAWPDQPSTEVGSSLVDVSTSRMSVAPVDSTAARPQVISWQSDPGSFYPKDAQAHGIEGTIRITVRLDEEGRPTDTRILSEIPRGMGFGAAASTMVHFMTFTNLTGHPAIVKLPVKFVLQHEARRHHCHSLKDRAP
jgi:TonB family protein